MIAAGDGHDRLTGSEGQVRRGRIVPARREDVHQWRQNEHDRDEGCDPAGRVADDRAEPEPEQTHNCEVERGAEKRTCDARIGESRVDVVPRQDRLADEERDQHAQESSAQP